MNLKLIYERLSKRRERYLNYAEEIAKLTLPNLAPKGNIIDFAPWTSKGTAAVRSLGSFLLKIMLPQGVRFSEMHMPNDAKAMILRQLGDKAQPIIAAMANRLDVVNTVALNSLNRKRNRSRLAPALLRNLIEGTTGINNTPTGIRVYPLRSVVVEREAGEARFAIFEDTIEANPLDADNEADFEGSTRIYTLADYTSGKVHRQVEDNPVEEVEGEHADEWFVFVGEKPDVGDYPVGYAWNYRRLIHQINHAEESLAEAMQLAAFNLLGIKEGTAFAKHPEKLKEKKSGDTAVLNPEDIFHAIENHMKIGDWAFVGGMVERDARELAKAFAQGIKDQTDIAAEGSATAVLEIVSEMSTQNQDLMTALEETLQVPIVRSELSLMERYQPIFPNIPARAAEVVRVEITTGVVALEKQRSMTRFSTGVLPMAQKMDPEMWIDGVALADKHAQGMMVEMEGVYGRRDPDAAALQQALMGARERRAAGPRTNGEARQPRREQTIMTAGGPQPPQPPQPPPPSPS